MNPTTTGNLNGALMGAALQNERLKESLDSRLAELLSEAALLLHRFYPRQEFTTERGLIQQLQALCEQEPNAARKHELGKLVSSFKDFLGRPQPDGTGPTDGQANIVVSSDKLHAFLVLTPPRGQGGMPNSDTVKDLLAQKKFAAQPDLSKIENALEKAKKEQDTFCLCLAAGTAPQPPKIGRIEFTVPIIDKNIIFANPAAAVDMLKTLWDPVPAGARIGTIFDFSPGRPGVDIFGAPVPVRAEAANIQFASDIEVKAGNMVFAKNPGYVIRDENRIEIVPLYIIGETARTKPGRLSFPGMVFSPGTLQGPGEIECDDIIVLGNCEQMKITCRNDVLITGGMVGRHSGSIDADGRVCATFISEAKVSAMRDVIVTNAIVNSNVISNSRIRVLSEKGMILGGKLCALQEIRAATIGFEFGMLTETVVGKDFLSSARLEEIARRIELHEQNLRKINELKAKLGRARMRIEQLPPDRQELILGVLRKEQTSINELRSLERRKQTLSRALRDFLDATIRILDRLYPPVRAQIGDTVREISERLETVTLKFDPTHGIVGDRSAE